MHDVTFMYVSYCHRKIFLIEIVLENLKLKYANFEIHKKELFDV